MGGWLVSSRRDKRVTCGLSGGALLLFLCLESGGWLMCQWSGSGSEVRKCAGGDIFSSWEVLINSN